MSDSLRDQLIAAGFDAPKKEARKKPRSGGSGQDKRSKNKQSGRKPNKHQGTNKHQGKSQNTKPGAGGKGRAGDKASAEAEAKIEERKKLKAKIKELIDESKTETWKGETGYRYLVDKKIRELYVSDELHKKLTAREVAVTRYNGETFIVPRDTGVAIKEINPKWSVFNLEDNETTSEQEQLEGDYADYQVPDDLQW